ncbi:MAG TPA: ABC transporter permease, partial [Steroidobacter sp.]
MYVLKQISAITRMNLRSIPLRPGTSSVVVIGIAGVVGVLVSMLAMVTGLSQTMTSTGRLDRAIVMGTGSSFEILSNLSRETTQTILDAPGIRRGTDARPVVSIEAVAIVRSVLNDGNTANVPLRGVGPGIFTLRPELRIVEGRAFEPSVREVIVGRSAERQF